MVPQAEPGLGSHARFIKDLHFLDTEARKGAVTGPAHEWCQASILSRHEAAVADQTVPSVINAAIAAVFSPSQSLGTEAVCSPSIGDDFRTGCLPRLPDPVTRGVASGQSARRSWELLPIRAVGPHLRQEAETGDRTESRDQSRCNRA